MRTCTAQRNWLFSEFQDSSLLPCHTISSAEKQSSNILEHANQNFYIDFCCKRIFVAILCASGSSYNLAPHSDYDGLCFLFAIIYTRDWIPTNNFWLSCKGSNGSFLSFSPNKRNKWSILEGREMCNLRCKLDSRVLINHFAMTQL